MRQSSFLSAAMSDEEEVDLETPPTDETIWTKRTRIMIAVNVSSIYQYPHPSATSRKAFEWTISKIVRSNGPEFNVQLLHVVPASDDEDDEGFSDVDRMYLSPRCFSNLFENDESNLLKEFVNRCHRFRVFCMSFVKKGDPKKVICSQVRRFMPDMLVVGSRNLEPFQRNFVTSVSEYCVKNADCPVIVIKRDADEAPDNPFDD